METLLQFPSTSFPKFFTLCTLPAMGALRKPLNRLLPRKGNGVWKGERGINTSTPQGKEGYKYLQTYLLKQIQTATYKLAAFPSPCSLLSFYSLFPACFHLLPFLFTFSHFLPLNNKLSCICHGCLGQPTTSPELVWTTGRHSNQLDANAAIWHCTARQTITIIQEPQPRIRVYPLAYH